MATITVGGVTAMYRPGSCNDFVFCPRCGDPNCLVSFPDCGSGSPMEIRRLWCPSCGEIAREEKVYHPGGATYLENEET